MIDLDAYFARIGYGGPRTATLETLRGIHDRHARTIPFENIDVLLGRGIPLDLPSLEQKLIREHRGGYCFEHNTLLAAVLRALGFRVTTLLARVRWMVPPGVATPRTHMVLRVDLDGCPWLADAGFGGVGLTAPIRIDDFTEQGLALEPRRLVRENDGRDMLQQVRLGDTWTDVYRFSLEEAFPIDFEAANWFTSTHPMSRFRQHLMVALVTEDDHRHTLNNRELTVRRPGQPAEKRMVESPSGLLEVLRDFFGLDMPGDTVLACAGLDWPK